MGRAKRATPKHLGQKLHAIRESLHSTLEGMIEKLNCPDIPLYPASISMYESGKREPPLLVLLSYAKLAKTTIDALADDKIKLSKLKHN